ncbi:MAG TPA: hypothetical protein VES89_09405 [Candidatus Competibacteraceae bacterium]|nr:hypothetical protein [Candidatus Competibacteraceae bacterium]
MKSLFTGCVLLALLPVALIQAQSATPPLLPLQQDILASSIRTQGYPCQTAKAMQRMESADPAIRAAWQVHCTEGDYAVVYRGNLGYQVRPLH